MKRAVFGTAIGIVLSGALVAFAQHGGHDHGSMGTGDRGSMGTGDHGSDSESMAHGHAKAEMHGGVSTMTQSHHFEVVYLEDGIRLYAYDDSQQPIAAEGIQGSVTLSYKDAEAETVDLVYMLPVLIGSGHMAMESREYLFVPMDLSATEPGSFQVQVSLSQLPGEDESEVQFTDSFQGLSNRPYMCHMHADVWGESADSKCPLCGMKTSDLRPATSASKDAETAPRHGGHSQ